MQVAGIERLYNQHSRDNVPTITVEPGEVFRVKTQLTGGDWLNDADDQWDPSKSRGPNLTTVVGIAGAKPGDTLAVHIRDVQPAALSYMGFAGWRHPRSRKLWPNDWDVVTKTVPVVDGMCQWSDELQIPVAPMIGTLGTAPADEPVSNMLAGLHGGNMDCQEVSAGTTIYLPVFVEGALLHVGDLHAVMGDGEICHTALECAGEVELMVEVLHEDRRGRWIKLEDDRYLMALAALPGMEEAHAASINELLHLMVDEHGFDVREALLLLSAVMEARCTLIHGMEGFPITYLAKIDKRYLRPDPSFVPYRGEMPEAGRDPKLRGISESS